MQKSMNDKIFDFLNNSILGLLLLIVIYPLYFTVIASFSDPVKVASGMITLLPVGLTLDSYRNVLQNSSIWIGYRNTILYAVVGTIINLSVTIPCAYGLSKKWLPGRKALTWIFLFTMYFSGGMIPSYLLVKGLHMTNTPWVMIILGAVSVYNLIITRTFYETSIPEELYEAARIDGCSEMGIFFRIALPLSSSIVAVMALFYGVGHWNSFFTALIYISNEKLYPLQLVLRNILMLNQMLNMDTNIMNDSELEMLAKRAYMAETMKYSLIFISSFPVLCAYPFVQKYFVRGVMIGSVKG